MFSVSKGQKAKVLICLFSIAFIQNQVISYRWLIPDEVNGSLNINILCPATDHDSVLYLFAYSKWIM